MTFVSHAQNYEDVMLRRALAGVERGFYIDVGANDPVVDSVTRSFYEAGWRGINVEPVAYWIERLRRDRPEDINLQVAASDSSGEIRFFEVVDTGLSTSNEDVARRHARAEGRELREYTVTAFPLTEICREHGVGEVHFLKIDVEGAERSVLEGLDLSRIRPWIVLVEATLPNTTIDDSESWERLLTDRRYHHVWFDGLNRFYVADERSELDAAFTAPPNVWDSFETLRERTARLETGAARARITELEGEHADLHGRLAEAEQRLGRWELEKAELGESLLYWQERTERAEGELRVVYGTRSWRLTAPLRLGSRALHQATHSPDGARLGAVGTLHASIDVARRAGRKVAGRLARFVREHPRLQAKLAAGVRRVPALDTRLRAWLSDAPGGAAGNGRRPAGGVPPLEANLPIRARRVLSELREIRSRGRT